MSSLSPVTIAGITYGWNQPRGHKGTDWGWPISKPSERRAFAAHDGTVISVRHVKDKTNDEWEYGLYIRVRYNNRCEGRYAHFEPGTVTVKAGDKVRAGQVLGRMGMTGKTFGPHIHHELLVDGKKVNAQPYFKGKSIPGSEPAMASNQRKATDVVNRRRWDGKSVPSTKLPLVSPPVKKGAKIAAVGYVNGTGGAWFVLSDPKEGLLVTSAQYYSPSTTVGLPNLTPTPPAPPGPDPLDPALVRELVTANHALIDLQRAIYREAP